MDIRGLVATTTVEGGTDGRIFRSYVEQVLVFYRVRATT